MFSSKNGKKAGTGKRLDTLLGKNTQIEGDIQFSGGIRIDGHVKGKISSNADTDAQLILSEHGSVEGEIRVANVIINGQINGHVYASQHIELASKARITGNVYYTSMEMALGAEVNGQLIKSKEDNEILSVDHEVVDAEDQLHLEQHNKP